MRSRQPRWTQHNTGALNATGIYFELDALLFMHGNPAVRPGFSALAEIRKRCWFGQQGPFSCHGQWPLRMYRAPDLPSMCSLSAGSGAWAGVLPEQVTSLPDHVRVAARLMPSVLMWLIPHVWEGGVRFGEGWLTPYHPGAHGVQKGKELDSRWRLANPEDKTTQLA